MSVHGIRVALASCERDDGFLTPTCFAATPPAFRGPFVGSEHSLAALCARRRY